MRLDVVRREGLSARILASGLVGTMAPPLKRARASVAEVFVGIAGFLAAALVLSRYATAWRGYPISPTMRRAFASELPAIEAVERAYRDHTITSAPSRRQRAPSRRQGAAARPRRLRRPCLRSAGLLQPGRAPPSLRRGPRPRHHAPPRGRDRISLDVRSVAPAQPAGRAARHGGRLLRHGSDRLAKRMDSVRLLGGCRRPILQGQTWEWPSVAYTLCPTLALVFLCVGGGLMLSRAGLSANACRWLGRLAIATGACLGLALLCTLAWSITLSSEAPGFLFWPNLGFMGRSLISVFVVTLVGGMALPRASLLQDVPAAFERRRRPTERPPSSALQEGRCAETARTPVLD